MVSILANPMYDGIKTLDSNNLVPGDSHTISLQSVDAFGNNILGESTIRICVSGPATFDNVYADVGSLDVTCINFTFTGGSDNITLFGHNAGVVNVSFHNEGTSITELPQPFSVEYYKDGNFLFEQNLYATVGSNVIGTVFIKDRSGNLITTPTTATIETTGSVTFIGGTTLTFSQGQAVFIAYSETSEHVVLSVQDSSNTGYSTTTAGSVVYIAGKKPICFEYCMKSKWHVRALPTKCLTYN